MIVKLRVCRNGYDLCTVSFVKLSGELFSFCLPCRKLTSAEREVGDVEKPRYRVVEKSLFGAEKEQADGTRPKQALQRFKVRLGSKKKQT